MVGAVGEYVNVSSCTPSFVDLVFRDNAFADDVTKTNPTAILKQPPLGNVRSF